MSYFLFPLSDFEVSDVRRENLPPRAVVFVHGIRSGHSTFEILANRLRALGVGDEFHFCYFDYKYRQSMAESAQQLADALRKAFNNVCDVTIVGHSMGGLVARLALLNHGHEMEFVKRLVMLATPNHGTLHTGSLGVLAGLTREATGFVWARMTSKTGVKELTEVDEFFEEYLTDENVSRTRHVVYLSVPAKCFHEGASFVKLLTAKESRGLALLGPIFELISAHPGWSIGLKKPHDGIVEEASVYLGGGDAVSFSERRATCEGKPNRGPYAHVCHDDHKKTNHVTIQEAQCTAMILATFLNLNDFDTWREQIYQFDRFVQKPDFHPRAVTTTTDGTA